MIKQKPNGGSSKQKAVLFALLIFLCTNAATGTNSENGQIVVPLQWVRPSEEVLGDFGWPGLDFEDRGWVGKQPVEAGLRGLPPTDRILFYGIFDLSAESIVLSLRPEQAAERLWTLPQRELPVEIYSAKQAHGLEIIGISVDKSREAVLRYVEKNRIEWPQVIEIENETKPTEIYHISGFPSYVWIGPDGVVINPELKSHLDELYNIPSVD